MAIIGALGDVDLFGTRHFRNDDYRIVSLLLLAEPNTARARKLYYRIFRDCRLLGGLSGVVLVGAAGRYCERVCNHGIGRGVATDATQSPFYER